MSSPVPERDCDVPMTIFWPWLPCVSSTRSPPLPAARPGSPDRIERRKIRQTALVCIVLVVLATWKLRAGQDAKVEYPVEDRRPTHPAGHQWCARPSDSSWSLWWCCCVAWSTAAGAPFGRSLRAPSAGGSKSSEGLQSGPLPRHDGSN